MGTCAMNLVFVFSLFLVAPVVRSLPEDMTEDMVCTACLAMADVFDIRLSEKNFDGLEVNFYNILDTICDQDNFRKYDYIPPKMVKACQQIIANNDEEDLEKEMLRYYKTGKAEPSKKEVEWFMCTMWSRACINVKRDKPEGLPVPDEEMYGETLKRMQKENNVRTPKIVKPPREEPAKEGEEEEEVEMEPEEPINVEDMMKLESAQEAGFDGSDKSKAKDEL